MYRVNSFLALAVVVLPHFVPTQAQSTAIATAAAKAEAFKNNGTKCSTKRFRTVDQYASRLMCFGKNGRLFPENMEQSKTFCDDTLKMTQAIEDYVKDCQSMETQNIARVLTYSIKRAMRVTCHRKQTKKLRTMLKNGPCANTLVKQDRCLEKFTNQTRELIRLKNGNDKLKFACCYYQDFIECLDRYLCSKPCVNAEGKAAFMDLIRAITGDLMNLSCGEYNESTDRCEQIGRPSKADFDFSVKINHRAHSFFFTAIAMLESLGESPSS